MYKVPLIFIILLFLMAGGLFFVLLKTKFAFSAENNLYGLLCLIVGVMMSLGGSAYFDRSPELSVTCYPNESGDPSQIQCRLENIGRKEAKDVVVGFNKMLPTGTEVFASADTGVQMDRARLLPDPNISPKYSDHVVAFFVKIPRIPPNSTVKFLVKTTNPDNIRAANQDIKIRSERFRILSEFISCVNALHPEDTRLLNIEAVKSGIIKSSIFFKPGNFSYENGSFPVNFIDEKEKTARAIHQDIYSRYKKECIDIFKKATEEFLAPVIRIETPNGDSTYATLPPYPKAIATFAVPFDQLKEGKLIKSSPRVPASY